MITVTWSPAAELDLSDIVDFIAIDNVTAAMELAHLVVSTVEKYLSDQPHMGRPGRAHGTRELVVHKNYVAVYRVTENEVQVLAIAHAARFFPCNV